MIACATSSQGAAQANGLACPRQSIPVEAGQRIGVRAPLALKSFWAAHPSACTLILCPLGKREKVVNATTSGRGAIFSLYSAVVALIVFLRGVNVGGHRTFRPSTLAKELANYDVVNVGAAGTFVVRKPGSRAKFRAALLRKLPFETKVAFCDSRELLRLARENPFAALPSRPDHVRFVSILMKSVRVRPSIPIALPSNGQWFLRLIASQKQFVFGVYRRHLKTIGYLGQLDKLFGVPATTRNWNTIDTIVRILKGRGREPR